MRVVVCEIHDGLTLVVGDTVRLAVACARGVAIIREFWRILLPNRLDPSRQDVSQLEQAESAGPCWNIEKTGSQQTLSSTTMDR